MKKIFLISLITSTAVFAQNNQWIIDNTTFKVDTLFHASVGPGTCETEIRISGTDAASGKAIINNIYYIETDLTNQYVEMRAAKGGNHSNTHETVPNISQRFTRDGADYFAGVNADFFNPGSPYNVIGMTIADGQVANFATPGADIDPYYIVFDEAGLPSFARHIQVANSGLLILPSTKAATFQFNKDRDWDELILYTPQWKFENYPAGHTGTNKWGIEVKLRPANGQKAMFGTDLTLEVVDDAEIMKGNAEIPFDGYVISAHGTAQDYIRDLKKGDLVTTRVTFTADNKPMKATNLLGGYPFIVRDNTIQPTLNYPPHLSNVEPRTAVGYSQDRTKITLLVVDGRKAGGSNGLTQQQLAQVMRQLGCTEAMNFDGGGSSTMYIRPLGLRNRPSTSSSIDPSRPEGDPRVVANALFAVATSPADKTIASIEIRDKKIVLAPGEKYTPIVYGYNRYGVMVDSDVKGFTLQAVPSLGSIDGNTITASTGNAYGALTANINGLSYSIPMTVGNGINDPASTIEITSDPGNIPVEYFNLQGMKISSPAQGQLVIKRCGTKVDRIIYHDAK